GQIAPPKLQAAALGVSQGAPSSVMTQPIATGAFDVAGVSWEEGKAPESVRMRAWVDGTWTAWQALEDATVEGGPDPGSAEALGASGATEPFIAAGASGLQIEVNGAVMGMAGLSAIVIPAATPKKGEPEPVPTPTTPPGEIPNTDASLVETDAQGNPVIHLRKEWGANEKLVVDKDRKPFTTLRGAVIHHTGGSNIYTAEQVPGIVNGIFTYHVNGNGWNDVGYNFLVDKYGRIWEGRAGGITKNVVGAHSSGFNDETVGISVLGNYQLVGVPEPAMAAMRSLLVWRLGVGGITDPSGTTTYLRLKDPQPIVLGHQDTAYYSAAAGMWYNRTDCPGVFLEPRLGELRVKPGPSLPKPYVAGRPRVTVSKEKVVKGKSATLTVTWTGGGKPLNGIVEIQHSTKGTWKKVDQIEVVDGVGKLKVTPSSSSTYRAWALAVTAPELGSISAASAYSPPEASVRVIPVKAKSVPKIVAPVFAANKVNAEVTVQWKGTKGYPPKMLLQARRGGRWVTVRTLTMAKQSQRRSSTVTVVGTTKLRAIADKKAVKRGAARPKSVTVAIRAY
ncbi:MAG: N-acetylmuramoyl-L-alanine amidase, partial [Micrococcales bacterium]|nr:N-acetylmuramoyl-L-alanine amidase [Micrococcales bacterium]